MSERRFLPQTRFSKRPIKNSFKNAGGNSKHTQNLQKKIELVYDVDECGVIVGNATQYIFENEHERRRLRCL